MIAIYLKREREADSHTRQPRCTKLVSARPLLHGSAEVSEGIRSIPTSGVSRRPESDILVLNRSALLPDQSVPRCTRCVFPRHSPQSLHFRSLVRPWHPGKFAPALDVPNSVQANNDVTSTSRAIIKLRMRLMHTQELLSWTHPILTSDPDYSFSEAATQRDLISTTLLCHRMSTRKPTKTALAHHLVRNGQEQHLR